MLIFPLDSLRCRTTRTRSALTIWKTIFTAASTIIAMTETKRPTTTTITTRRTAVSLTPYRSEELIDDAELGAIIDRAFADAGLHPDDIDAGVVILTGEALRRENAEAIANLLAEQRGEFVCATAGHHMESILAAFGSGAARVSRDSGKRILNVDIGGGTTKLALVEHGKVIATAALHVGGRLLVIDEGRRIVRLDPAGRHLAAQAGFHWSRGDVADAAAMERVAEWMADAVLASVSERPFPAEVQSLFLTEPLPGLEGIDGVMFSGGVAEYVYERETREFGDMGPLLGRALRRKVDAGALPWPLLPPGECIRATALGASEYSVQLSGNTIYISNPGALLPRRNLQVLQPSYVCDDRIDLGRIRMPSQTVPVTVKSLVFSEDPRAPHGHTRRHGHDHHGQVPPG